MADDFRVGDVVVCVDDDPRPQYSCLPTADLAAVIAFLKTGRLYRIADINGAPLSLRLVGDPFPAGTWVGYNFARFRKLPPASDEFTQRIRACRSAKFKVPA